MFKFTIHVILKILKNVTLYIITLLQSFTMRFYFIYFYDCISLCIEQPHNSTNDFIVKK